jgi:DNA primase small subunit
MKHPSWNSKRIAEEINETDSLINEILYHGTKAKKIINIAKSEKSFVMIKDKGIIDFGGVPEFFDIIIQGTKEKFGIQMGAKTDEPVTADIRRLIRMPSSLHGGSGMRVVPLTLAGFKEFEPLRDAVVFSEKEINIEVTPPLKPQNSLIEMKGKTIKVEEGINILPEYAGIYLMCRGAAEYA